MKDGQESKIQPLVAWPIFHYLSSPSLIISLPRHVLREWLMKQVESHSQDMSSKEIFIKGGGINHALLPEALPSIFDWSGIQCRLFPFPPLMISFPTWLIDRGLYFFVSSKASIRWVMGKKCVVHTYRMRTNNHELVTGLRLNLRLTVIQFMLLVSHPGFFPLDLWVASARFFVSTCACI